MFCFFKDILRIHAFLTVLSVYSFFLFFFPSPSHYAFLIIVNRFLFFNYYLIYGFRI